MHVSRGKAFQQESAFAAASCVCVCVCVFSSSFTEAAAHYAVKSWYWTSGRSLRMKESSQEQIRGEVGLHWDRWAQREKWGSDVDYKYICIDRLSQLLKIYSEAINTFMEIFNKKWRWSIRQIKDEQNTNKAEFGVMTSIFSGLIKVGPHRMNRDTTTDFNRVPLLMWLP